MQEYLKKLNAEQLAVVKHEQGPLLVVAGAGTGKTTVLINRLAYLVLEKKLKTDEILLATFTEKAAGEMLERAEKMLPYGYLDLWINTFHGLSERILRQDGLEIGLSPDFKLIDSTAQWVFLKKNLDQFSLKYYHSLGSPNKFISELLSHFSRLKDENISVEEYQDLVSKLKEELEVGDTEGLLEWEKMAELSQAYKKYQELLIENNFLDFGDLINYAIKLFRERPNILKAYQEKFKYIMIDEFQDTNYAQYEFVKILSQQGQNLMVVGDDDQSIYKFRGASISNIMQFKDDYPEAQEIVLNKNYRSQQEILDLAYGFIKNNDPHRLEAKLGISKKLQSLASPEVGERIIKALNFASESDELNFVSSKIREIYQKEEGTNWRDFAILARSNNAADKFSQELSRLNIPNHFVSLKGLYKKAIIIDIISYFKLLDNYRESSALYRVLGMKEFRISSLDLMLISTQAKKKYWSLFEALKNIDTIKGLSSETISQVGKLLRLVETHTNIAAEKKTSQVFLSFIFESELLKNLDHDQDREIFSYINQFYQKIKKFEEGGDDLLLKDFVEMINFEIESGDAGNLKNDFIDIDTVKVMTIHSAKGLEFKYVFLVDLVERRFPSDFRSEKITLAPQLIKERVENNDNFHIEEERRLFYVALTRAKQGLFLTSARDYGGAREKRPSVFFEEAGIEPEKILEINFSELEFIKDARAIFSNQALQPEIVEKYQLPKYFSFSQFAAFDKCPLQYKYAHLLKIPSAQDKPSLVFGRLIHDVLYNFLLPLTIKSDDFSSPERKKKLEKLLSFEQLMFWYDNLWNDEGYASQKNRDEYFLQGQVSLEKFYQDFKAKFWPNIYALEKDFRFKFKDYFIKGKIDRIDELDDGSFEIIDYKTGSVKDKLTASDKQQLLLYQIVAETSFGIKVSQLSYYFVEDSSKISFTAKDKDLDKIEEWILENIKKIEAQDFSPKPSAFTCQYCDFKDICEFREI